MIFVKKKKVAMLDTIGGATEWNYNMEDVVIQKATVVKDKKIVTFFNFL